MRRWSRVYVVALMLAASGCSEVRWKEYRGPQHWPIGGAFVSELGGVPLYEGLPEKSYSVIGMIEVFENGALGRNSANRAKVLELVQEHHADAMIWLSERVLTTGSLKQALTECPAAMLSSGAAAGGLPSEFRARESNGVRNSVLLIRWN